MVWNYSTSVLRAISQPTCTKLLFRNLWLRLCELGISRPKPTRRGRPAGNRINIPYFGCIQTNLEANSCSLLNFERRSCDNQNVGNLLSETSTSNIQTNTYVQQLTKNYCIKIDAFQCYVFSTKTGRNSGVYSP